jgi:hypothetical protein
MTGPRGSPPPGIKGQALHTDEAASARSQQAQETITPDAERAALVGRSVRLLPAAYRFYRAIFLTFVAHSRAPEPEEVEPSDVLEDRDDLALDLPAALERAHALFAGVLDRLVNKQNALC